ncbi:type VII secretion-associated serine protease [Actinomadura sp. NBRC 104412]|nr:type VII secretion-associated serine protease [Actinomadura sp. NBRC 104412]
MRRWSRAAVSAGLAVLMIGATASPGAAAARKPHPAQWWFGIWDVEKSLWPHGKGRGVTVAVIDTGVQASLPDLSGAVLPGADFQTGGGGDARTDNKSFSDGGHGTRMATLIASRGTGTGLLGVAPEAKILPVVGQSSAAFTKGIRFAADRGAKVINLSQAAPGPCPADMQAAIAHAIRKDAVVVAGAGNDGNGANASNNPANCVGVLAVGAADITPKPWVQTQRQPYVKVAGPGVLASGVSADGTLNFNKAGTSQAAALTSGVVALIRSAHPEWSNREVVRQLVASAKDIGPKGKDDQTGYGFTRPYRIFEGMIPKSTPNPVFEEYDRWAATHKEEADPQNAAGGGARDDKPLTDWTGLFGMLGMLLVVVLAILFALYKTRRSKPAAAGPVGPVPGAPPTFGTGPYPGPGQPPQPGSGAYPSQGMEGRQQSAPPGQRPRFEPPLQEGYPPQTHQDIPQQPPQ